jgi:phospholipase C
MSSTRISSFLRLAPYALAPSLFLASCGGDDVKVTAPGTDAGSRVDGTAGDAGASDAPSGSDASDAAAPATGLAKINHFVVIYMENHSFDNLYGEFPNAEGLAKVDAGAPNAQQTDGTDTPYATLPFLTADGGTPFDDAGVPNGPFAIEAFIPSNGKTHDMHHIFFTEQFQINDGGMNKFVYWSDALGLSMGYWHTMSLPVPQEAAKYTVCDHFFHAAFGGSFLNHQWLVAAQTPAWPSPPDAGLIDDPAQIHPGQGESPITADGYAVNTIFSVNGPRPYFGDSPVRRLPAQTYDTIGDRLSAKGLDWAWYAGGWNDAVSYAANDGGLPDGGVSPALEQFQYHHQPFVYFANYADGTPGRAAHLKDEADFVAAAAAGQLPAVSFVKPVGIENEHPGYADVLDGDNHLLGLIQAVESSPQFADTAIIVTYDEHGGSWDHVPPPKVDRWGPGSRVPAIVISKYARKQFVDATVYDTTSILATIEKRWGIAALSDRDRNAATLEPAFDFSQP